MRRGSARGGSAIASRGSRVGDFGTIGDADEVRLDKQSAASLADPTGEHGADA